LRYAFGMQQPRGLKHAGIDEPQSRTAQSMGRATVDREPARGRLRPLAQESLRSRIVNAVRDAIVRGEFKPGEKVPEHELAQQLGVSRTPIREALRILEYQGLVETRPKRGTFIAGMRHEDAHDGLAVRTTLEEMAISQAIERHDEKAWEDVCDELQGMLDAMRDAVSRMDPVALTQLDINWHAALVESAGNRYLSHAWWTVGSPMLIWSPERDRYPLARDDWVVALEKHERLLAVLRTRDEAACSAAIREHIIGKR
jgi:DNA-binding GntR family transcriptional regulator